MECQEPEPPKAMESQTCVKAPPMARKPKARPPPPPERRQPASDEVMDPVSPEHDIVLTRSEQALQEEMSAHAELNSATNSTNDWSEVFAPLYNNSTARMHNVG